MSSVVDSLEILALRGGESALKNYLAACDDNRFFSGDIDATKEAIALTNRLLNEADSRLAGLLILRCLLSQIPAESLQSNALSWLQQTAKGLAQIDYPSTVIAAAELLKTLLPYSSRFPEIRKETSLSLVNKISELLYEQRSNYSSVAFVLEALLVVQDQYNKSIFSWKDRWEQFLLTLIAENERVVTLAGKCYLGLACSGHPGTDHINFKNNWQNQLRNLSWYLHQILDKLIVNLPEIHQFSRSNHPEPTLKIPIVNEKILFVRIGKLTSQFIGLCKFVQVMLLGKYPVSKKVIPELVFSVICRGLAVTVQVIRSHVTSDTVSLLAQLPRLHSACLATLEALIKSCRTNLLSYAPVICKLITQVLKTTQTQDCSYGQQKPFRSVRKSAYNCLRTWLTAASCSSGVEKHPEIVEHIISDIHFKKPPVTLNLSSKSLKGKMGKKQRQALVNQTVVSRDDFLFDVEANEEICSAALKVIPALLESASSLLKSSLHKNLQTIICNRILAMQLNTSENVPLPYSNCTCRLGLYESFVSLCLNYHPDFPPPLAFAARLLENGLHDPEPEIVRFCALSMSSVDKMLRPIGPTLYIPIELDETILDEKNTNIISTFSLDSQKVHNVESTGLLNSVEETNGNRTPVAELAVNPLLEDVEMSEFDYLKHPEQEHKTKENSPGESSFEALPVKTEQQNNCEPVVVEKRKITSSPEGSTKKRKSSETESSRIDDSVKLETSSMKPIAESSIGVISIDTDEDGITAENDLEEEMLSSFVDDVI